MDIRAELEKEFGNWPGIIAAWGRERPDAPALDDGQRQIGWDTLSDRVDRIAAQLLADGLQRGQAVAILGTLPELPRIGRAGKQRPVLLAFVLEDRHALALDLVG